MKILVEFNLDKIEDKLLYEYVYKCKQDFKKLKACTPTDSSKMSTSQRAKKAAHARWNKKPTDNIPAYSTPTEEDFDEFPLYPDGRELIEGTWNEKKEN